MNDQPKVIVDTPAPPVSGTFKQQLFGPWTAHDPKVQQQIVRTQPSAGSAQRVFSATYPPAPTIKQGKTAITGGYEFTVNVVNSGNISGYNIYSSAINNPNVATLIRHQPQPPYVTALQSIKIQDITSANPFYWVASVNAAGKESTRILVSGNASPVNVNQPLPSGGGSGSGAGGGAGVPVWKAGINR